MSCAGDHVPPHTHIHTHTHTHTCTHTHTHTHTHAHTHMHTHAHTHTQSSQEIRQLRVRRSTQLWRSVLTVTLLEGCNLPPMDDNGTRSHSVHPVVDRRYMYIGDGCQQVKAPEICP